MKLFVTIAEESADAAVRAMGRVDRDHDGIEVRAERFAGFDPAMFRAATRRPVILTFRGREAGRDVLTRALDAGIDFVDVEYRPGVIVDHPERTVLSHHDYEGMPDLATLVSRMMDLRCAHTKIAVTPQTFAENVALLAALDKRREGAALSVMGMGERGLYSRILAPFRGSELAFVAPTGDRSAAPGQITLERALEIYGPERASLTAKRVFAVVGNPAGHSRSPSIHNPLFRDKGVPAAYTIASVGSFNEITNAFLAGEPCGLSITAPYKEEAFAFAQQCGATLGENARAAGSVNTLVRIGRSTLADNTDVDGFTSILEEICGRDRKSVALAGAGGTARAAMIALQRAGMHVTLFNRTEANARKLGAPVEPLDDLARFDGEIIINTTSGGEGQVPARAGMAYIEAAYGSPETAQRHERLRAAGVTVIDGLDLLRAQAVRQHELFMKVFA